MAVAARPRKACNQGTEVRALLAAMVAGRHNGHLPPEMDHHLDHHMDHQPHSQQDFQVGARTADAEAVVAEWAQRLAATVEAPGDPNAAAAATAAAVAAAQGEDDDDEEGGSCCWARGREWWWRGSLSRPWRAQWPQRPTATTCRSNRAEPRSPSR